jgi:LPXTG-motif cell wall-anchored protein
MPRSRSKRSTYRPPPRKRSKHSPRWFGFFVLGLMFVGVLMIVLNYFGLIPGTGDTASNTYLFLGLGFIAAGFIAATQWR